MQSLGFFQASEEQPGGSRAVTIPLELPNELPLPRNESLALGHVSLRLGQMPSYRCSIHGLCVAEIMPVRPRPRLTQPEFPSRPLVNLWPRDLKIEPEGLTGERATRHP